MRIPIISASSLKFGELWDKGINDLIRDAGKRAMDDAGLQPTDVDSLFISNVFSSKANGLSLLNSIAFEELGIGNSVCISAGDASGSAAIGEAANSIMSGQSKIAMVLGAEKVTDFKSNEIVSLTSEFLSQQESFIGATVQSQFAIITKKYIHDFRLNSNDLSFIPSKNHKNALDNEHAQFRFELKEDKILSSPVFSEPIRMFDCAAYCDGAAALVMCDETFAKKVKAKIKGYLLASSLATDSLSLSKRKSLTTIESTVKASKLAFDSAGISKDKIDLLEVHDIVPISEVLAVEDLGFAKKGSGMEFIKNNINKINLSGGLKACGHAIGATGLRQAADLLIRLKNSNLKYGITHAVAGTGGVSAVNIFEANQHE